MIRMRPLIALALSEAASISGTRLSMIAIPWLVLSTFGDPFLTGVVGFAELLPYVLVKAACGPLIDRLGARRLSVVCDLLAILTVGAIPVLHALDALTAATLIPAVALTGALRGPADAAKYALVPSVAKAVNAPLSRVTGIMGSIERLGSVAGAGLGAALVAALGPADALAVNAVLFAVSVLAVTGLGLRRAAPVATQRPGYLADLAEGARFMRSEPVLVGIVVMVALTNFCDQAMATVLMPVWAKSSGAAGGVGALGLLFTTFALSSFVGAVLASAWADRLPRLATYTVAYLLIGLPRYAVFALGAPIEAVLAVSVVSGFASGFINPVIGAVSFERIPPEMTGRVSALVTASAYTLMPFGGLAAGALIAATSLPLTFLAFGLAYFLVTTAPLLVPSFRQIDQQPTAARVEVRA